MTYVPDAQLAEELSRQGLNQPSYELDDAELRALMGDYAVHPAHAHETEVERMQRAAYALIWRDYGVPNPDKVTSGSRAPEMLSGERIVRMHEAVRKATKEDLPSLKVSLDDIAKVLTEHGVQSATQHEDRRQQHTEVVTLLNCMSSEICRARTDAALTILQAENQLRIERAVLMTFAKRVLWGVVIGLLLLMGATLAAPHLHAQIDVIQLQNSDGSKAKTYAAPFKLKAGVNCTWSISTSTATFNCAGSAGSVAWDSILSPAAGGLTLSQFANGNDFLVVKRKTDTLPTGSFFRFQTALGADICALSIAGVFSGCSFPYANVSGTPTLPANTTATAHNFFTAYNSSTGAFNKAQPVCGDLSDAGTLCASSAALAVTIAQVAHKWLDSYTSSTGAFTQSQPACGDLSNAGTLCQSSAALAANTTATAHNFFTAYNSTTGAFTKAQPVCGDLSDAGTLCTSSAALAQTIASVSHKWLNSYTASTGAFTQTQPVCADLSDSGASCTHGAATTVGGATCTLDSTCTITRICEVGLGDGLNAITAGTYKVNGCYNDFGATYTITAIRAFTDNSGSSTMNAANDAATGLLTGAVTATSGFASGTQSATTTIATSHWIVFTFVADGTSKTWTGQVTLTR